MMERTDQELLEQYRQGEVTALEELTLKYKRQLFGYIVNMTGSPSDADDIFQDVWFRVIRKQGSYRHGNFLGWLIRIAHNLVIDKARRKGADISLDAAGEGEQPMIEQVTNLDSGPAAQAEDQELGLRIASAVEGLPAEQREVFVMRVQSDLPFKEIAKIQKTSINTALARMQYALGKLRTVLKGDYDALARS